MKKTQNQKDLISYFDDDGHINKYLNEEEMLKLFEKVNENKISPPK